MLWVSFKRQNLSCRVSVEGCDVLCLRLEKALSRVGLNCKNQGWKLGSYKGRRQEDRCRHSGITQVRDDSGSDSRGSNRGGEEWSDSTYLEGRANMVYEWAADGLNVGCERKRGIKDERKVWGLHHGERCSSLVPC